MAYGADGSDVVGWGSFALSGVDLFPDPTGGLTPATDFLFQAVFAATAVMIASGAMAERTKFSADLVFSLLMTAIIYPVVVHWTWGGGLVAQMNIGDAVYSDFAGSAIVHSVGGWAALVGAWMLGPRRGKFAPDGTPRHIGGHDISLAMLGVFILWLGWFGFNPGSELAADTFVMFVALNTMLAACAGAISATAVQWIRSGKPDVPMAGNGVLAGLVGITAGEGTMNGPGAIAGAIVVFAVAVAVVERVLKVDDPVGAFAVHGACGVWGALAIGLFARYDDAFLGRDNAALLYGGGIEQLVVQFLMVVIIAAWVIVASFVMFSILKYTMGLRVSQDEELTGLDISEHGLVGFTPDDRTTNSYMYDLHVGVAIEPLDGLDLETSPASSSE